MKFYIINDMTNKIVMKGGRTIKIEALHEKIKYEVLSFKTQPEATLWLMKGKNKVLKGFTVVGEDVLADKFSINFGPSQNNKETEAKVGPAPKPQQEQKPQTSAPATTPTPEDAVGLDHTANIEETVNTVLISETLELLERIASMKARWAKLLAESPADIRRADSAITDALHLAEFRQLTPAEAVNLVNKVHDNRVERRRLKNEAAVAQNAATLLNNISNEELMRSIYFIRNMGTRKYTPRTGDFFESTEQKEAEG